MNKHLLIVGFVSLVGLFGCSKIEPQEQEQNITGTPASRGATMAAYQGTENAKQGVVIVKFKREYKPGTITLSGDGVARTGVQAIDVVSSRVGAYNLERVFPYAEKFEKKRRKHGLDLWYRVSYDTLRSSLSQAAAAYSGLEELAWVQTARRGEIVGGKDGFEASEADLRGGVSSSQFSGAPFNDPMLSKQWWIDAKSTSVPGIHPDASINLFTAWGKVRGSRDVIVCVVDGCVKWDHDDLAANMWNNTGEIPYNSIDDDQNGFIDDVWGFDFATSSYPSDYNPDNHGTHVAGIIGAVNNNGLGVCSIAGGSGYGDGVRIMSCQIKNQVMTTDDLMAAAIEYGANMGAVISQNSWGYSVPGVKSEVVREAIAYFNAEAGDPELFPNSPMRGGLVIFAAGNSGDVTGQQQIFPAAYEEAIAVAAIDQNRQKSSFSCYGPWVDIAAPGGYGGLADQDKPNYILSTYAGLKSNYGYFPGTSQACPMVSGVAALLIQANPGKSSAQIKELLLSSVASLEPTEPNFALMGSGMLDASKYLFATQNSQAPEAITDLQLIQKNDSVYSLQWTVPSDNPGDWVETYTLYFGDSEPTQANLSSAGKVVFNQFRLKPAGQSIKVDLADSMGVDMKSTTYFALVAADQWANVSQLSNVVEHAVVMGSNPLAFPLGSMALSVLKMSWPKEFGGQKTINVYDRSGRRVAQKVVSDPAARVYDLSVSALASGNYTVEVVGVGAVYRRAFRKI